MLVGNLGSSHQFNYLALGAAVNLSSRIESLSKLYGTRMIIGDSTRKLVPDFAVLDLDTVVDRTGALKICGALGAPQESRSEAFHEHSALHVRILPAYRG